MTVGRERRRAAQLQYKESYAEKEFRNSQREREKRHRKKVEPEMLLLNVDESFSALFSFALYYETHKRLSRPTTKTRQKKKFLTRRRLWGLRDHERTTNQAAAEKWELGVAHGFSYFLLANFVTKLMADLKPAPNKDSPPRLRAEKFQVLSLVSRSHGNDKKSTFLFREKTLVVGCCWNCYFDVRPDLCECFCWQIYVYVWIQLNREMIFLIQFFFWFRLFVLSRQVWR